MKLSLIFLASTLMVTTFGQNLFYLPFPQYSNMESPTVIKPYSYGGGRFLPRFYQQNINNPDSLFRNDFEDYNEEDRDLYGRSRYQIGNRGNNKQPFNKFSNQNINAEDRLFLRVSSATPVISVVTVFGTTSSITQTATSFCLSSNQFNLDKAGGKLSTTACRRKREEEKVLELIEPTFNVDKIEFTPSAFEQESENRKQRAPESSQDILAEVMSENPREGIPRFGFGLLNIPGLVPGNTRQTIVTTVTIPVSVSIINTNILKPLPLVVPIPVADGTTGAIINGLNCLPNGVVVC